MLWIIQPVLFIVGTWIFSFNSQKILSVVPSFTSWYHRENIIDYVKIPPTKSSDIWQLSILYHKINQETDEEKIASYLSEAQKIVNWTKPINASDLKNMYNTLIEIENNKSITQRIMGFMSFINIIWLLSILGIILLTYPALSIILNPFAELIMRILTFLWDCLNPLFELTIRVILFLWNCRGLFEPIGYIICFLFLMEGARFHKNTGLFISLTGLVGFSALMIYSDALHKKYGLHESTTDIKWKQTMYFLSLFLTYCPTATLYSSPLLAWFTVISLYSMMGFGIVCHGLCWYIGWQEEHMMPRTTIASFILVILFSSLKYSLNNEILNVFTTPVLVLGNVTYFLALLIMSSSFYHGYGLHNDYANMQIMMIFSLVAAIFFGNVFYNEPLLNTSITFLFLYIGEKISELKFWSLGNNVILLLFLMCVALYFTSLWLHTHPKFLINIVSQQF